MIKSEITLKNPENPRNFPEKLRKFPKNPSKFAVELRSATGGGGGGLASPDRGGFCQIFDDRGIFG